MKHLLLTFLFILTACPTEGPDTSLDTCTEIATRCRLAPGKLGVCTMGTDQVIFCASQH